MFDTAMRLHRPLALVVSQLLFAGFLSTLEAQEARGRVICVITENGASASGTVTLQRDGQELAAGTCGKELSAPPGNYTAIVRLDGALDGPVQQKSLSVSVNGKHTLKLDFVTGTLEIRIASQGKRAAGMAIIKRDGQQIGTLGSGVVAHLSAGTYQVVARCRTQEKNLGEIKLAGGQNLTLDAAFD